MPAPHPAEFRQRAVELAQIRAKPVAEIARDLRNLSAELGPRGGARRGLPQRWSGYRRTRGAGVAADCEKGTQTTELGAGRPPSTHPTSTGASPHRWATRSPARRRTTEIALQMVLGAAEQGIHPLSCPLRLDSSSHSLREQADQRRAPAVVGEDVQANSVGWHDGARCPPVGQLDRSLVQDSSAGHVYGPSGGGRSTKACRIRRKPQGQEGDTTRRMDGGDHREKHQVSLVAS